VILSLRRGLRQKGRRRQISSDVQSNSVRIQAVDQADFPSRQAMAVVTLDLARFDNAAQRDAATHQGLLDTGVKQVISNLQIGSAPPP